MKNFLPIDNKTEGTLLSLLFGFIVIVPFLNLLSPEASLYVSSFQLGVWGKYLCYAILAISLNMLWGYTGLLCLGQCLFFALGGYAFGMYLMLAIGELPAFMGYLGYQGLQDLPAHWVPFHRPVVACLAVLLVPGLVAFIFGTLAFRSRIKGVYFSILTQALTYAAASGRDIKELLKLTSKFCKGKNLPLSEDAFAQCAAFRSIGKSS